MGMMRGVWRAEPPVEENMVSGWSSVRTWRCRTRIVRKARNQRQLTKVNGGTHGGDDLERLDVVHAGGLMS